MRRTVSSATIVALMVVASILQPARATEMRDIVFVANAEDGTVDLIDAETFELARSIDVIPDGAEPSPGRDPVQAVAFPLVVGAAGNNFAQDLDVSPDGRTLYVSRGHLGDVTAFDITTGAQAWVTPVGGVRADHMDISHDGSRLFVSDIINSAVEVIDSSTGAIVGRFPTGEWSHDNHVSHDGSLVYNGSIGNVLTPPDSRNKRPSGSEGVIASPYQVTIANADTLQVVRQIPFERGVRPFVLNHDETILYAQLSEFHGIVEVDVATGREIRRVQLPIADGVTEDDYDFEAPHHGIAMAPDESLLCAAGRASDYAALVSTETMSPVAIVGMDDGPGWAGNTPDGSHCVITNTRADTVAFISYETYSVNAVVETGDGPKYITSARIPADVL